MLSHQPGSLQNPDTPVNVCISPYPIIHEADLYPLRPYPPDLNKWILNHLITDVITLYPRFLLLIDINAPAHKVEFFDHLTSLFLSVVEQNGLFQHK